MSQRSEAARGFLRITANYIRLASTFLIGLLFVRLALRFGNDAFGLIMLMGVSTGLLSMIHEVVNWSMVRELGAAYHSKDERHFRTVLSTALVACICASALVAVFFAILGAVLPWLDIEPELLSAARWYVFFSGCMSCLRILFAPLRNMYMITERMGWVSFWEILYRLVDLLAVSLTLLLIAPNPHERLIWYAGLCNSFWAFDAIIAVLIILRLEPWLRPSPWLVSRRAGVALLKTGGWNTSMSLAMNLGNRADGIIMNKFFGLDGNVIFGLGLQVSAYARMITFGMTIGVEAAATRISSSAGALAVRGFINYTTRMHGWVALPAALGCFFLVEPFLHLWVGSRIDNPAVQIPQITAIARVLLIALTIRNISDGWTRALYGAGYIRSYAPLIFFGSLFNPPLSVLFLWIFPAWYTGPAWAHAIVYIVVHALLLPVLLARRLQIHFTDTLVPLGRPLAASLLCSPILIWGNLNLAKGDLKGLVAVVVAYAACYLPMSWFLVLDGPERRRFAAAAKRRLLGRLGSA